MTRSSVKIRDTTIGEVAITKIHFPGTNRLLRLKNVHATDYSLLKCMVIVNIAAQFWVFIQTKI